MKKQKMKYLRFCFFLLLLMAAAALFRFRQTQNRKQQVILPDTDSACIGWLQLHGWNAADPVRTETVMPDTWETVPGQEWLRIQHAQDLHPEYYAGKPVTVCTLSVLNGAADCRAVLWLCENELAGAEIYHAETQLMQSVI